MAKQAMIAPMQTALRKGDLKACQELISGGFPINKLLFDGKNRTALHVAVDLKRHKLVAMLLLSGADPDVQSEQFQETALHQACEEGDLAAVSLLLDADADPDVQSDSGISPIMLAAEATQNASSIVHALLAASASVVPNSNGRNPLHSNIKDAAIVQQLIQAGADVNGSFHGITPLMKALEPFFLAKVDAASRSLNKPQPKVVAAMIEFGANPRSQFPREMRYGADAKGQSIIDYALQKKLSSNLVELLQSSSGQASKSARTKKKSKKKTAVKKK